MEKHIWSSEERKVALCLYQNGKDEHGQYVLGLMELKNIALALGMSPGSLHMKIEQFKALDRSFGKTRIDIGNSSTGDRARKIYPGHLQNQCIGDIDIWNAYHSTDLNTECKKICNKRWKSYIKEK